MRLGVEHVCIFGTSIGRHIIGKPIRENNLEQRQPLWEQLFRADRWLRIKYFCLDIDHLTL